MSTCTCTPGHQCEQCRQRRRAVRLLMRVVPETSWRNTDPVRYWDARTSGNDARTALCIVRGVPLDQIHPANGTAPWEAS